MILRRDSGFRATQVNGCVLWLRADKTIQLGGTVYAWADQSSLGNDASQVTGADQPILSANAAPYGQAGTLYAGTQFMNLAAANVGVVPWTVFAVHQNSGAGTEDVFLSLGTSSNGYFFGVLPGAARFIGVAGVGTSVISGAPTVNTWECWTISNNGTLSARVNGVTQTVSNNTFQCPSAPVGGQVGAVSGIDQWQGAIAEIIVYNRILLTSESSAIYAYLLARYGIVA